MRKAIIVLCTFLLFATVAEAQNLVPNPSFEVHNDCVYWVPGTGGYPTLFAYSPLYNNFPTALYWIAPLKFTNPSYYNICDTTPNGTGVPTNLFGFQQPHSGDAYAGIYLYNRTYNVWSDLRGYLEARLTQPMEAEHLYYISFHVSLATSYTSKVYGTVITTDNVGAYISDTMVLDSMAFGTAYLTKPVTVRNPPGRFITDTAGWTKIEGTYIAHGGEQWITLGRFNDGQPLNDTFMYSVRDSTYRNDSFVYCHTYIDDVCVMDISDSSLFVGDTSFCVSSFPAVLSSGVEGERYEWNTGATTATISVNKAGLYWRLTTGECLYHTDTFRVQSKPVFYLGNDTTVCREIPILLGSTHYDSKYLWSTGDTTCCIPVVQQGMYALTISNYCGATTHSINLEAALCNNCLLVPNAFTPNRDGINDLFEVRVQCPLRNYRLRMYNRYGQMIFESTNPAHSWDGTFKGLVQGLGVYYYYIEYTTMLSDAIEMIKGNVTLIK